LLVVLAKRVVKELALGDTLLLVGMMAWGMASTNIVARLHSHSNINNHCPLKIIQTT
jgi:hypothetical protein